MSHKRGAHLDGVADIEGIRMRCICDSHTGCWHFRTARGKPMVQGRRHVVWLHGRGPVSVPRAVWELSRRRTMPEGWRAFRTCHSFDCANPRHIKAGAGEAYGKALTDRGVFHGNAENARNAYAKRIKLNAEMRQWVTESSQFGTEIAHALDVSPALVCRIRATWRSRLMRAAPSVFEFGRITANVSRAAA